jgi:hypothetical protein
MAIGPVACGFASSHAWISRPVAPLGGEPHLVHLMAQRRYLHAKPLVLQSERRGPFRSSRETAHRCSHGEDRIGPHAAGFLQGHVGIDTDTITKRLGAVLHRVVRVEPFDGGLRHGADGLFVSCVVCHCLFPFSSSSA